MLFGGSSDVRGMRLLASAFGAICAVLLSACAPRAPSTWAPNQAVIPIHAEVFGKLQAPEAVAYLEAAAAAYDAFRDGEHLMCRYSDAGIWNPEEGSYAEFSEWLFAKKGVADPGYATILITSKTFIYRKSGSLPEAECYAYRRKDTGSVEIEKELENVATVLSFLKVDQEQ